LIGDVKAQIDKFKAAARELECDESEEAFRRNLRAVAKTSIEKKSAKR